MTLRLILIVLLTAAASASAAGSLFYLGTYTWKHTSEGIYAGTLDSETGKLGPITLAAAAENPSYLALSRDGKFLYAALEAAGGAVGAFRVEGATLALINTQSSAGEGACYVSLDAGGQHAFVANYNSASIAALPICADGSLAAHTGFEQYAGSGPDASRQKEPHAHSIYPDETGDFIYSCDLGTDRVRIFRFDGAQFAPGDPPAALVPPGGGPRHLAWRPGGKFAYVNSEMGMSVTVFARPAPGRIEPIQTISSLPDGVPLKGNSSAAIRCHPNGRWLYVSNRGHDSLTTFCIGADGRLERVGNVPAAVKTPRDFAIDPSGKWLIAAGQNDDRICVFKIDAATGELTPTGQSASVGKPVCVLFASTP